MRMTREEREDYWRRQAQYEHKKAAIKLAVFTSQENVCRNCGTTENLSLDHIHPLRHGGGNEIKNFQILCINCNRRKKDKLA